MNWWAFCMHFAFYLTSNQNSVEWKSFFFVCFLTSTVKTSSRENFLGVYAPSLFPKPHWVYWQVKWVADLRMWKKCLIFLSTVSVCPFFIFWFVANSLPCRLPITLRRINTTSYFSGLLWLDMPRFYQNAVYSIFFLPVHLRLGLDFHSLVNCAYWEDSECFMFKLPWVIMLKLPSCQNACLQRTRLQTSASQ